MHIQKSNNKAHRKIVLYTTIFILSAYAIVLLKHFLA